MAASRSARATEPAPLGIARAPHPHPVAERPASGVGGLPIRPGTISACLIVRDEEGMLPACLDSLRGAVDEVVVVDTGSRDRTPEIAREGGARVHSHPWEGDFAAARNASLRPAHGEWLLIIDADERLRRADGARVTRADLFATLRREGQDVYDVRKVNYADPAGRSISDIGIERRVARNHPRLAYAGRVHEQLTGPRGYRVGRLPPDYELHHFGYTPEAWERTGKRQRNLDLLQRMVGEQPDAPHVHFFLGRELLQIGQGEAAAREFQGALQLLRGDRPPYWFDLVMYWVASLRLSGRLAAAIAQCDAGLAAFPAFSELWLIRGRCLMAQGRAAEALDSLLRCLAVHGRDPRVLTSIPRTPALAWMEAGLCYAHLGEPSKALAAFREGLCAYPALQGGVEQAARVALGQGIPPEAFEEWVAAAVDTRIPEVAASLWSVLGQQGRWERAARWADVLAEVQPGAEAEERLGVTLMRGGRWDEALAAFARAEAANGDGPLAPNAAWCRALLGLALGRDEVAARALAALGDAGGDQRARAARDLLEPLDPDRGGLWWGADAGLRRGVLQVADQLLGAGADGAASRLLRKALTPPVAPRADAAGGEAPRP